MRHPVVIATSQNEFGTENALCCDVYYKMAAALSFASSAMVCRDDSGDHPQPFSYGRR